MEQGRPITRGAVRAGMAPAPPPIRGTSSSPTPSTRSQDGASSIHPSPKPSRPVTPEHTFSSVVSGRPPSTLRALGVGLGTARPGLAVSEPNLSSELPSLSGDVDFGATHPDEDVASGWIPVTRDNARTHSPRSVSPVENKIVSPAHRSTPVSESTINQAEANMSRDELLRLAERYRFYAEQAIASAQRKTDGATAPESAAGKPQPTLSPVSPIVPTGEGSSKDKGKGVNPGNFGAVPSLIDFTEDELAAQQDALANFGEVHRVFKQESMPTPPGFFDDAPLMSAPSISAPHEEQVPDTAPTTGDASAPLNDASARPPTVAARSFVLPYWEMPSIFHVLTSRPPPLLLYTSNIPHSPPQTPLHRPRGPNKVKCTPTK
ncbi:hypothetical protein B0H15DRAFT_958145 [Mycena belliarum]|uniref:Uncharacterized protein n=1 Tax=Mycena belliarum TaxID=1033014 RepID=A0AAD6TL42_9AGAR|nr:hypothetical protein B0H15DRAFT_958145 [Mycena belliae]